jgi:hypothetical protein
VSEGEGFLLAASNVRFLRNADDRVVMIRDGEALALGNVMSAFPLTGPGKMVSVRDEEGEELGVLDDIHALDAESRQVLREELERSYFMPRITDILDVREELSVVTWEVETNRGFRTFHVRHVRQNVRKLGRRRLVIKDVDGNRYEVKDWITLPPHAQKLIQNYL